MEQRPLGRTGRTITAIGLGCVTFGMEIDEEASYRIMDYAVEKGITFFDTSEAYGGGQAHRWRKDVLGIDDRREATQEMSASERIIGTWMRKRGCRDQITLCTKINPTTAAGGTDPGAENNIPGALEGSLRRLDTDHVEIYLMHHPDPVTPIAETLGALSEQVQSGRVGAIGGSNYTTAQFQEALEVAAADGYSRFEVCQPAYSLLEPEFEEDMFPLCQQEEVAVTPFSPLGAGFLTGKFSPDPAKVPKGTRFDIKPAHVDMYFKEKNFRIVDLLRAKAAQLGLPMVRLAMAWAMTHPLVTSTLIGARTTDHIDNALAAFEMGMDGELRAEMSAWTR